MKVSSAIMIGLARATITADEDGSCQLLSATCDENGFEITFNSACRDSQFKAVNVAELYANGPTYSTSTLTYGTTPSVNAECLFVETEGVYKMNFNYNQCGTTHADDNADSLVYYNRVQGYTQNQEYYTDIVLGVHVDFHLTCTADRVAVVSSSTSDIAGDEDFISLDAQERPEEWAQNVLSMNFFSDSGLSTEMTSNLIPLGETIFSKIEANVANENLKTRITDCWATASSATDDTNRFNLITSSCVPGDERANWVTLDHAANGASESTSFSFQSFRFKGQSSFWLHCQVYLCHGDETCTIDCEGRRKRRFADIQQIASGRSENIEMQDNGLPQADIISQEFIIVDQVNEEDNWEKAPKLVSRIDDNLKEMQQSFAKVKRALKTLKKSL